MCFGHEKIIGPRALGGGGAGCAPLEPLVVDDHEPWTMVLWNCVIKYIHDGRLSLLCTVMVIHKTHVFSIKWQLYLGLNIHVFTLITYNSMALSQQSGIIIIIIIINTLFSEGSILRYYSKYNKLIYNMAF